MGIAGTFNEQHKVGQDLNGELGVDFFNKQEPLVISNTNNRSSATLTASVAAFDDYSALTGSDYELKYNGGSSYSLMRLSDNKITEFPDGLPETPVEGLTLSVSDDVQVGDRFTIRPTVNAARDIMVAIDDPSKIASAMPLRTQGSLKNLGTGKVGDATINTNPGEEADTAHPATDARLQQPFIAGLYRHKQTQVYVSRGTGYWGPPMRVGAPAEVLGEQWRGAGRFGERGGKVQGHARQSCAGMTCYSSMS